MDLIKKKKLLELRKKYQYDTALSKQNGHAFTNDEEELEVLALLDLNSNVKENLEEFLQLVDVDTARTLAMFGMVISEVLGRLAGRVEQCTNPMEVEKAFKMIDDYREKFRQEELNG